MVPLTSPEKFIAETEAPLQTTISLTVVTVGVGFTMIVNVFTSPSQALAEGVTVIFAVTGVVPVLTALNVGIFPVPVPTNPMEVVLFDQE